MNRLRPSKRTKPKMARAAMRASLAYGMAWYPHGVGLRRYFSVWRWEIGVNNGRIA